MKYILYPSKDSDEICKYVVSRYNQKIISFEGNKNATHYSIFDKNISVYDWLSAIINSSIIITDSFHCAAFALVFNKKFICLKNNHAQVRFTSLFKKLGINIKIVEKVSDIDINKENYDINKVNAELEKIRETAVNKIWQIMKENVKIKTHQNIIKQKLIIMFLKGILSKICSIQKIRKNNTKRKILNILGIKIKLPQKKCKV